jgi:beta-lactamase class A
MSNGTAINAESKSRTFSKKRIGTSKQTKDADNSDAFRQQVIKSLLQIEAADRAGLVKYGTLEDLDAAMSRAIQRAQKGNT